MYFFYHSIKLEVLFWSSWTFTLHAFCYMARCISNIRCFKILQWSILARFHMDDMRWKHVNGDRLGGVASFAIYEFKGTPLFFLGQALDVEKLLNKILFTMWSWLKTYQPDFDHFLFPSVASKSGNMFVLVIFVYVGAEFVSTHMLTSLYTLRPIF